MPLWLPGVLVAMVGIIPGVLVYRAAGEARRQAAIQADRTGRLEERKADREELQSALDFWRTSFDAVTLDNRQLRAELDTERGEHRKTRVRVDKLERVIRRAGLEVPNGNEAP